MANKTKIDTLVKSVYSKDELTFLKVNLIDPAPGKYARLDSVDASERGEALKAIKKRAVLLRSRMKSYLDLTHTTLEEWAQDARKRQRLAAKADRENLSISRMVQVDTGMTVYCLLLGCIRGGSHIDTVAARYSDKNGVVCRERNEGYAKTCRYPKVVRDFTLNVRKGWHVFSIGGLLTFVKGDRIDRAGMKCQWVEQGASISNLATVDGYLVKGQHIKAKSLKEAVAVNNKSREKQLADILKARHRKSENYKKLADGTLRITFGDSIGSGNCHAGTMNFKNRYEAAIGHKADDITMADLRKYGKEFGVTLYAERAIRYAAGNRTATQMSVSPK